MIGIRLCKIFSVNYAKNTVDILMTSGFGIMRNVKVAFSMASTQMGQYEMPVLKTVGGQKGTVRLADNTTLDVDNLYPLENLATDKSDFEDPTSNYVYGLVVGVDEQFDKGTPIVIGFVFPHRNTVLFDPDNPPTNAPAYVQNAIRQLKGALVHKTNSGVYWTVDLNGNLEFSHPNGSFFRMAESPTEEADGVVHVDYSGKNVQSSLGNVLWDTLTAVGADNAKNSQRSIYAHLEVKTDQSVVMIQVNKSTGDVVIRTPKDSTSANSATTNKVTIIAGGNATLQSVQGDVTIESVNRQVLITGNSKVTVETTGYGDKSIILAPKSKPDYLPLFTALATKFNKHKHVCPHGGVTSAPDQQLEQGSDSTNITVAG